ncbi:response regulator [Halomarina pelagica]|uniref:response regulator n=1 Tax=Halomarina pelagica TaxID=2961599 RepID=UPI0020C2CDFD|nr:response regulator [Halomarina sp. BND7]
MIIQKDFKRQWGMIRISQAVIVSLLRSKFCTLMEVYLNRIDPTFQVTVRTSAEEGLQYLAENEVDCILSDYEMPEIDGLDLLETVRTQGYDLPFILVTGRGSEEIASEAISAGVSDYIQKSAAGEQYELLANRIRNLVQKYRTDQQIQRVYEAIEIVDEGISLIDVNGEFVYVNKRYADILGYTPNELIGKHWSILYRDEAETSTLKEQISPDIPGSESSDYWTGQTVKQRNDGTRVRTDHRLAYTSDEIMVCLLSNPTEVDTDYEGPVVEMV